MSSDETAHSAGTGGPPPFDVTKASQARMYDYLLGGKDNFEADRVAVDALLKLHPGMEFGPRANRAFLGRAVRYLAAEAGVRQFLDIGTGIPTEGNVHEIAQGIAPESRVVYVDYDPVVLTHARALLGSTAEGATEYVDADLRDTDVIIDQAREVLDFSRPVSITLIMILHAIPEADDPHAIVARLLDAVPSGSYLTITHPGLEFYDEGDRGKGRELMRSMAQQRFQVRTREQVARFFEGTDLVDPGLVLAEEWRPAPGTAEAASSRVWCAVGRKR